MEDGIGFSIWHCILFGQANFLTVQDTTICLYPATMVANNLTAATHIIAQPFDEEAFRLRLSQALGDRPVSDVARDAGLSDTLLRKYLGTGKSTSLPGVERLVSLALALGVNLDWLATGRGDQDSPYRVSDLVQPYNVGGSRRLSIVEIDATAGAGSMGGIVISERPVAVYTIDEVELEDMLDGGPTPRDPFVIRMIGESMEPDFRDGERLIIEPYPEGERRIMAAGIYLFRMEDAIEVKQLERLPGKKLRISARNSKYTPYTIDMVNGVDFAILGRVRGRFQRY
ncbi:MAG: S24 family peptidase [Bacteroidota bacterium]